MNPSESAESSSAAADVAATPAAAGAATAAAAAAVGAATAATTAAVGPATTAARRPASIFVSHGSPTLPLDDIPARAFLKRLGRDWPLPRAIVAVSAHTIARGVAIGSAPRMHAVHDFGGFPDALYRLRYDPPGDPELAARIAKRVADAGVTPSGLVEIDGLDHGIWVPLMLMRPEADIPVVVVSLDARMDPALHAALGRALSGLGDEGVLVMGTGAVTHNLQELFSGGLDETAPLQPYAVAFTDAVTDAVRRGDLDALRDWTRLPHAHRAHPSADHYLPLLVAAAAGGGGPGALLHESFTYGALGMHAYAFGAG
jgi:4,5-DOPA dioxygenase extradiol